MTQGVFFKIDRDSDFEKGQIIFRYTAVEYKNLSDDSDLGFPIYLVLNKYSVDVFSHGPDLDGNHSHARILHLPLTLNLASRDNLLSNLERYYDKKIDLHSSITVDTSENSNVYKNLDCFSTEHNDRKIFSSKPNSIFLRDIILDFIFDLEHSKVFQASPNYEEIEAKFKEDVLFSAISAKAAYYYNRNEYINNSDAVKNIHSQRLADAELQWLNIIRLEPSVEIFWNSRWFKPVEMEYKAVLFSSEFSRENWRKELEFYEKPKINEHKNKRILRNSARWYLRRYSFNNGIKSILQFYSNKTGKLIILAILCFVILPIIFMLVNDETRVIGLIFYLLLGLFPFIGISAFILKKMFIPLLSALLPRLLMAIASSWIIFLTTEELVKVSFDIQIFSGIKWFYLLLVPVIAFMAIEIKNMAPDIQPKATTFRIVYILIIGFFYSILIGMFFINFMNEAILVRSGYLKEFFTEEVHNSRIFYTDKETKALMVGLSDYDSNIYNFDPYESNNIIDTLKAYKINLSVNYNEISNQQSTKLAFFHKEIDAINAQTDSLVIMNILSPSLSKAYRSLARIRVVNSFTDLFDHYLLYQVPVIKNRFYFDIIPGMLLYRAIFALFIGIFVQLIFEDKPITEPL